MRWTFLSKLKSSKTFWSAGAVLLLFFLFFPVRMTAHSVRETIYEYETVEKKDIRADLHSLAGLTCPVRSFRFQKLDASSKITVFTSFWYLRCDFDLHKVVVRELTAVYQGTLRVSDSFDRTKVRVTRTYADGKSEEVNEFSVEQEPGVLLEDTTVYIKTDHGNCSLPLHPVKAAGLSCTYTGTLYAGDAPDPSKLKAVLSFADGSTKETDEAVMAADPLTGPADVKVTTPYVSGTVHIDPVRVKDISAEGTDDLREEQVLSLSTLTLTYEDGHTKSISADEVTFKDDVSKPLLAGTNRFRFAYKGQTYLLEVDAREETYVERAVRTLQDEVSQAMYSHVSDSIFVTISHHEEGALSYYLTHIIINDPSQMKAGLSYDDYGGSTETPTSASRRLGWVIGTNGSNFDYGTGEPTFSNVKIKEGALMARSGFIADGREICMTSDGTLYSPAPGTTAQALLDADVKNTFACGDTLLLAYGQEVNLGINSEQVRYPRTAIGMVKPCEYYLITAGSGGYKGGATYDEIRNILVSHDCQFGKCMDGGGSSSLVFENQLINEPATGKERAVVDFLYFTE